VISGILPNVIGYYDGKPCAPNLYCYILAPYGAGKGALNYAEYLGRQVHQKRVENYRLEKEQYQQEYAEYLRDLAAAKKGGNTTPEKPEEPKVKLLFIPANNSKSGVLELLGNNDGKGIIFETEGDALTTALQTDFGNYSDSLRNAFHHEPITFFRRTAK
jgi:hypothetical protein